MSAGVTIQVRLKKREYDRLKALSRETGLSISALGRQIVEMYIRAREKPYVQ